MYYNCVATAQQLYYECTAKEVHKCCDIRRIRHVTWFSIWKYINWRVHIKTFIRFCPYHNHQCAKMIFILPKKIRERTCSANKVDIIETISRFTNMIGCLWRRESIISKTKRVLHTKYLRLSKYYQIVHNCSCLRKYFKVPHLFM